MFGLGVYAIIAAIIAGALGVSHYWVYSETRDYYVTKCNTEALKAERDAARFDLATANRRADEAASRISAMEATRTANESLLREFEIRLREEQDKNAELENNPKVKVVGPKVRIVRIPSCLATDADVELDRRLRARARR